MLVKACALRAERESTGSLPDVLLLDVVARVAVCVVVVHVEYGLTQTSVSSIVRLAGRR